MNINVTVGIPTKDRYEALAICLTSIAFQTMKPKEIIIVDDSDFPKILTEIPSFQYIFELFNYYKISWRVIWGFKKGQHFSHNIIQDNAISDYIFRIDDDCMAEPNVLEELWSIIQTDAVGAAGCCILMPNPVRIPKDLGNNSIHDLNSPNIQWFTDFGLRAVGHLNSSFLYRKGITRFNESLSKVAHREETIFTHEIKRAGYTLFATSSCKIWHFRQPSGGIRTDNNPYLYERDDQIFQQLLKSWNYKPQIGEKIVVLDNGLGDHFAFKHILGDLQKKYTKIVIAACYPDVFFDIDNIKLISIAEAKLLLGDISKYDIYTWMDRNKHKGNLVDAFNKLYNEDIHTPGNQSHEMGRQQEKSQGLPVLGQVNRTVKDPVGSSNSRALFPPRTRKEGTGRYGYFYSNR